MEIVFNRNLQKGILSSMLTLSPKTRVMMYECFHWKKGYEKSFFSVAKV